MTGAPFFIVGVTRSGSTLLRVLLDRHPVVAIPPESHFIPRLHTRRRRYGVAERIDQPERFLGDLAKDHWFERWELPISAVRDELRGLGRLSFAQGVESIFRAFARRAGKPRWGDKTPRYIEHMPLLARLFPRARFVHMIRDGRDVALSLMDWDRKHSHPASPAFVWSGRIRKGLRAAAPLGAARYLEVHYERLLEDVEGELRRLCAFLDMDFDPVMLRHDGTALEKIPPIEHSLHQRLVLPPTKGLRDWRRQMTPAGVAEFEAIAGRVLTITGYARVARAAPGPRLQAWWHIFLWVIRRERRRVGGRRGARARRRLPGWDDRSVALAEEDGVEQ